MTYRQMELFRNYTILINYPHETWKIKEINFDKTGDGELKRGHTPWIKIQQLALYIILVYSKVYD